MAMMRRSILVALVLMAAAFGVLAELYKWVDEKGVTHYTESPPPGKKAQELRNNTSSPSSAEPSRKPPAANKQSTETRPNSAWLYDRNRLTGSWGTAATEGIQVSIVFRPWNTPSGAEFLVGQRWVRGDKMSFNGNMHYKIYGSGGRGILETSETNEANVPARIGYALDGNALILSVNGGIYAGKHRLTKQK